MEVEEQEEEEGSDSRSGRIQMSAIHSVLLILC